MAGLAAKSDYPWWGNIICRTPLRYGNSKSENLLRSMARRRRSDDHMDGYQKTLFSPVDFI